MGKTVAEDDWGGSGKKKDEEMDLDITPMIDVTFLLLIFFMVSSTMQATPDYEVPPAKHGKALETKEAIIFIIVGGGKGETPTVETGSIKEMTLEQVTEEVERVSQSGKKNVILRADGKVPTGFVSEVANAAYKIEGMKVSIGVRDKNKG